MAKRVFVVKFTRVELECLSQLAEEAELETFCSDGPDGYSISELYAAAERAMSKLRSALTPESTHDQP